MSDYGLNIGSRRSRNVIVPTFSRDFINNSTLNHGAGPNLTLTRGGSATVFTSTGIISSVAINAPRFDWGNFRTNFINNSTMTGATTGIIGAGGTIPNFWGSPVLVDPGLSAQIVSTGTITNLPYIDLRIFGTNTSVDPIGTVVARFSPLNGSTAIPSFSGQRWTGSVFMSLISGSTSGFTDIYLDLVERNAVGTYMAGGRSSNIVSTIGSNLIQLSSSRLFQNTQTLYSTSQLAGVVAGLSSVNAVFRIAAPQQELGTRITPFIPTTNAPVTTGEPLGLLLEEQRTNVFLYSGELTNSYWEFDGQSITQSSVSLDGNRTFTSVVQQSANTDVFKKNHNPGNMRDITVSAFVKPISGVDYFRMWMTGTGADARFDIRNGTITRLVSSNFNPDFSATSVAANIQYIGNQWYRCSISTTYTQPLTNITTRMQGFNNELSGSLYYLWGIQQEDGIFPTSYIPTTALTASRSLDLTRCTPVSSFVSTNGAHTFFVDYQLNPAFRIFESLVTGKYPVVFGLANTNRVAAASDQVQLFHYGVSDTFAETSPRLYTIYNTNNTIQFVGNIFGSSAVPVSSIGKYAVGFGYNSGRAALNNNLIATEDTSLLLHDTSKLNSLSLGNRTESTAYPMNGYIRQFRYWPTRLSNNRLRLLTQ